jgi:hypothetical protein
MKIVLITLSAFMLLTTLGYTQKVSAEKVPVAVKQAFATKFPAATDVKFEKEKKAYEINFKEKGVEMSANFDAAGKWLETEMEIKESDLPKEVFVTLARNFGGFKVLEVAKVLTPDKGTIYEMDLKKDKEGYEVRFSATGTVLKKTPFRKEKEEEEKD